MCGTEMMNNLTSYIKAEVQQYFAKTKFQKIEHLDSKFWFEQQQKQI